MKLEIDIQIPYQEVFNEELHLNLLAQKANVAVKEINKIKLLKRSLDARKKDIKYQLRYAVFINERFEKNTNYFIPAKKLENQVVIIGAGPGGLFAALRAIELGIKPIVFERGKDIKSRRRDLVNIHRNHIVNPNSNYCFGEGGAGTFSDGKLYTRSKKRGNTQKALEWFVNFGANEAILIDAHPHIGTNKLPRIIENMRQTILNSGGEIHFNSLLTDIIIKDKKIIGIVINDNEKIDCEKLILATGHSARDIYYLLNQKKIKIEAKPFALGVRIEHPQSLIDTIQYHGQQSNDYLPPASYSLVTQANGMGVYSFCMCPGGIVAPCATSPVEVVTNGWSPSKRNNPFANSGMVVQIEPLHLSKNWEHEPFVCLDFQKKVEHACWEAAGKTQKVPAQRLLDFIQNKKSKDLPETSYQPGIVSINLNDVLPEMITSRLKIAFTEWGNKMKGFLTNDAILHAPESRTSSPVKISRNADTYEHEEILGLYPCGEGAGYAGGIMSAAVDGMNIVDKIGASIFNHR